MTDFKKMKITFALALLGTLFALHPIAEKYKDEGFLYLDIPLKAYHAYALLAGLLALAVYFFAMAFVTERPFSWVERAGNTTYALALLVVPLYGGFYLAHLLEEQFGQAYLAIVGPVAAVVLGGCGLMLVAWVRYRLGKQDQSAKVQQLVEQEMEALGRAQAMFANRHYDLSVIEAWKAIEARLRRVLVGHGIAATYDNAQKMIAAAAQAGILQPSTQQQLQELRGNWNVAVSTVPLTREAAEQALHAAREILSTIPLVHNEKGSAL